jgi:hypothetical protein
VGKLRRKFALVLHWGSWGIPNSVKLESIGLGPLSFANVVANHNAGCFKSRCRSSRVTARLVPLNAAPRVSPVSLHPFSLHERLAKAWAFTVRHRVVIAASNKKSGVLHWQDAA